MYICTYILTYTNIYKIRLSKFRLEYLHIFIIDNVSKLFEP